jgi:endoglucanase
MPVPELLRTLLTAPGPSGYEQAATEAWRDAGRAFAEVHGDALGSSVARVAGTGGGPLLAIVGHIDEIGLAITHADEHGFLAFRGVGGWDAEVLRGQRVEVLTRDGSVPGVVGRRWRERPKRGEERKPLQLDELHVDIGARDRDEALRLVRLGDVAVLAAEPLELRNGHLVSRALDDRLGAYVALEAARRIAEAGGAPGDVAAVAAVQEEVGDFAGARTIAFGLEPAVAIVVDVTGATDVPGGDPKVKGEAKLGAGPAIARGSPIAPAVYELLCETAEAEALPYTVDVYAGTTNTDADAVHLARSGIPTGLLSLPTRYLHTPTETVALDDVEAAVRLIVAFARRLEAGTSFTV